MEPEAYRYAVEIFRNAWKRSAERERAIRSAELAIQMKYVEERQQMMQQQREKGMTIGKEWNAADTKPNEERTRLQEKLNERIAALEEEWKAWVAEWNKRYSEDEEIKLLYEEDNALNAMIGELLGIVITFDEEGNPVSSVDLAKYGLSMPIFTPKLDPVNLWGHYTVTFPHETENATPQTTNTSSTDVQDIPDDTSPTQQETPTKNSIPLWLGIFVIVIIGGGVMWKIANRKKGG